MTDTSDRDELVRLAGEQALLSRDLRNLNADQQRDLLALRNLPTDMVLSADWHAKGTALLDRLQTGSSKWPWATSGWLSWPSLRASVDAAVCFEHLLFPSTQKPARFAPGGLYS